MSRGVRGSSLPALSLARPVTMTTLALALLVLGLIAWRGIPIELLPSGFTPPFLFVQVPTLRSAPSDVESRVAIPIEENLATVRNLVRLGTRVQSNSVSFIMEFADGTDMDSAYNQVRDRVDRALPGIGDEVGPYWVWKYNPADDPVVWFGISSEAPGVDLTRAAEDLLVPRLERLPGISRVEVYGAPERGVTVSLDDRLVRAAGTTVPELVGRLTRDNFSLTGGAIGESGERRAVRVVAELDSVDALRNIPAGNGLRLGEIAEIRVEDRAERSVYRVNERPGVFFAVYREASANAVEISDAVRSAVEGELRPDARFEGITFHFFFDQGEMIRASLGNVGESAELGALLAIVILWFFLRRTSVTLLIACSIPASLLFTLVVMYFLGRTLNVLSLTGLMLSVGMVVDNAIVVVEAIETKRRPGRSPRESALLGASEVALPILVSTLTTVVVFVPVILMSGSPTISFYLTQIGLPVCVALIASLLVSLLFVPLAVAAGASTSAPTGPGSASWGERAYGAMLARAMRRPGDAALLSLLAFASIAWPASRVPETDRAEANINDFRVFVELPPGYTWEERNEALLDTERVLWAHRDELFIRDLLTRMGGYWGRAQHRAFLADPEDRSLSREEIVARARELLPERPGVQYSIGWNDPTAGAAGTTLQIVGPDTTRLAALSIEIMRRITTLSGVSAVENVSSSETEYELLVEVDRDRAWAAGISPWTAGTAIDFALRGRRLPALRTSFGELPVWIEGDLGEASGREELDALELPSPVEGVTLGSVSDGRISPGFGSIDRENRRTVMTLQVHTDREDLDVLDEEIDRALAGFDWPRGYSMEKGERFQFLKEGAEDRAFVLGMAALFVFLLMGVLFESFIVPLAILFSIPFAFTGVYWALWVTDTSMDLMAAVGLVILIGVVVNNAIVLVDLITELRREGVPRAEAIVRAGPQRLRPILMTAATTVFGLVPMSIGTAALVGIPYAPMGRALIGGMVASTLVTLVIVPVMYVLLDDLRELGIRAFRTTFLAAGPSGGAHAHGDALHVPDTGDST